jgi:phosphate transport system substrate-binding protein
MRRSFGRRLRRAWGWRARTCTIALVSSIGLLASLAPATVASASPSLESTGSSFAGVAIQQWVGQAATLYGLNINWQVSSSVIGLDNFAQSQIDFGASDIPYSSGQATSTPNFPYQYMPDVAGALAFMYNLTGAQTGTKITNLVLDAQVIDDIFSGKITTWNAAPIVQLNPGECPKPPTVCNLPSTKILAVYRVDASGENYLLSDYLLHMDSSNFRAFQTAMGIGNQVGEPSATWPTLVPGTNPTGYPGWNAGDMVGQNGSDNAANYVSAAASNGAITYVETAYAIEHNEPVASVLNQSGNAVQPTSVNDATALEKAVLNADLTQNLDGVYLNPLPNAYPVSSYSYLVTPCSPSLAAAQKPPDKCSGPGGSSSFPTDRGQALGQFVSFLACAGQQKMALLGYSPLPPNLVQEDFDAVGRLNGGQEPAPVSAADCKNPYVDGQTPLPGEPSVVGQAPGTPGGGTHSSPGGSASGGGPSGGGPGGGSGGGGTGTGGSGSGSSGGGSSGGGGSSSGGGSKGGSGGGSKTGGGSGRSSPGNPAAKYLAKLKSKGGATGGQSPFLRAANLRAAASSALGFASPIVQIIAWCAVLAVAIYLPVVALGRRRRKGGKQSPGARGASPGVLPNLATGASPSSGDVA